MTSERLCYLKNRWWFPTWPRKRGLRQGSPPATHREEGAWDAGSAFITQGPEQRPLNTSESQASRNSDKRSRPSHTMSGAHSQTPLASWGCRKECGKGTGIFLEKHGDSGAFCEGRGVTGRRGLPAQTPACLHTGQYSAGAWVGWFTCLFVLQGALLPSIFKAPWYPK